MIPNILALMDLQKNWKEILFAGSIDYKKC